MAKRIVMSIVADGVEPAPGDTLTGPAPAGRFHTLIVVEGVPTGDDREFVEGSLSWRDLPLPLMAKDTDEHGSMGADTKSTLIGNIDTIERQGTEIHGWGSYITEPGEDAARLIGLVERGELRGVSADIDNVEFTVLFPVEPDTGPVDEPVDEGADMAADPVDNMPRETIDGQEYVVVDMPMPILRVTEGRVMGATVVPFPAFQEAFIEPDGGLAASACPVLADYRLSGVMLASALVLAGRETAPARFVFPELPPSEWFDVPETPGPMPLTILDSGQVFGHLAVWGECHVGIGGECVEPPQSATSYARFHVGETPCDDGTRVSTGRLTFHTGHADTRLGPDATRAHYDDTGNVAADLVAVDGEYGIWVCGAMRSDLSLAQVREVMASPPSGDWRRFGRSLELVAALCVNVPGFNVPRYQVSASAALDGRSWAKVRKDDGLVASLIVSHPAPANVSGKVPRALDASTIVAVRERIAASIGRSTKDRVAALSARVHGSN
jgi:hypothetical protein